MSDSWRGAEMQFAGRTIDHVIPNLAPGDGASDACLAFRSLLIDAGADSRIWAESIHPGRREFASKFDVPSIRRRCPDLVIVHYTTGSDVNLEIARSKLKFVVFYQNVTPADFFIGVNDRQAGTLWRGRAELPHLLQNAQQVFCPSQFSANDVRQAGWPDTIAIPIPVNRGAHLMAADQAIVHRYEDGVPMILFVGRIAPNKCQHELLAVFHCLQSISNKPIRLVLVGSDAAAPRYRSELDRLIQLWNLRNVEIPGLATQEALAAYYQCASIFLSLSKHEGFGIPLIEAMQSGVPVVAREGAAVGETVGDGGIVFKSNDPAWIAAVVAEVIENKGLRRSLIAGGRKRGEELRSSFVGPRFLNAIAPFAGVTSPMTTESSESVRETTRS